MATSQKILLLIMSFIVLNVYCIYSYMNENKMMPVFNVPQETQIETNAVSQPEEPEPAPTQEATIEQPVIENKRVESNDEVMDKPSLESTPLQTLKEEKSTKKVAVTLKKEVVEPTKEEMTEEIKKEPLRVVNEENLQLTINEIISQNRIIFKRLSTDVTQESFKTIEKLADILKQYPSIKIEVGGHTDAKGDDEVNAYISKHRALSVKKILVEQGIEEERLSAKGYGESEPIVQNDPQGYSIKNRRVEFKIIKE
jgi:outer membrane protein OmpA-like peptidoglycan-associated protein